MVKSLDPVVASQSTVDKKLYGAEVWDVVGAKLLGHVLQQGDLREVQPDAPEGVCRL